MLTRVYVDNFRCFSNFELRPGRINLLLGHNGSGKSSLMEVLTAILRLVRTGREVADVFPAFSLTRWDSRADQRFELDIDIDGRAYRYSLQLQPTATAFRRNGADRDP